MQTNTNATTHSHTHYAHPLITWGPTLMGATVAIVLSVMLNLLGAALGFGIAAAGQTSEAAATGGIMSLVWMVAANVVAIACGSWIAARSTQNPDHHGGTLQGVAVWAVTSLVVLFLAGSAISGAASTMMQSAGLASSSTIARENANGNLQNSTQNAANEAQATVEQNRAQIEDAAVKTAGVSSAATFGTFLAMLLGLIAAVAGARAGARHPAWTNRPHYYTQGDTTTPSTLRKAA